MRSREKVLSKIAVIGAGAMGSSVGGVLAESGLDVILIDQWDELVNELNRNGLTLVEDGIERVVKVSATKNYDLIGTADVIIVLVKSYHTEKAIKDALPIIGKDTMILSLQNGLGNEEKLKSIVGNNNILGGVTHAGSVLLDLGKVALGRKGKNTYIGELDGRMTERIQWLGSLLNSAGWSTIITDDIYSVIWNKLLVNIAVSPLSAITGLPHAGMANVNEVLACAYHAVEEAIKVAHACNIKLSTESPQEIWSIATSGLPPDHKSSMLKDIEKRSKTEIETINGAVVEFGKKHNVETPVNETLVACIKGIEHQQNFKK
jgi:2-dehydropantoate 2-reductase